MRKATAVLAAALVATTLTAGTASATGGGGGSGELLVLGANGVLTTHDADRPLLVRKAARISGLGRGDQLVGIDVHPANGVLYALSAKGQLYTVDKRSGRATAVGAPVALSGKAVGFDFNPTVDRIRVITDSGQNLRLVPDTGALAATDGPLAYAAGDVAAGTTPRATAAGYTNSVAGATGTVLYDIDAARDTLVTQGTLPGVVPAVSPNTGQLLTVGELGLPVSAVNGFDVKGAAPAGAYNPADYRAVAAVQLRGISVLVKVDLATGKATFLAPLLTRAVGVAFAG